MDSAMVFSFLYFIAFGIALLFGILPVYINPRGKLNRQVFIVSIAMCFWAYGFIMANSAADIETCLFWRRFSAIGWTTAYATLLHVLMILTDRDKNFKKIYYPLIYLPAAICLYVFAISDRLSRGQYNLIKGVNGWVNISVNNGWDFFFYAYYISYVSLGLILLLKWRKENEDKAVKSQASITLYSIIIMGVLGTTTDIIINMFLENPIPQMAPVFNLIPIVSLLHSAKKNSYMKEMVEGREDLILTATTRMKLYFYTSFLFLAGGIITTATYFLPKFAINPESLKDTVNVSLLLYLIGILIIFIQFIRKEKIRDFLVIVIMLASIPFINFMFIDYGAITVWVFPIILMLLSLVFNSQMVLLSITIVSIITQFFIFLNVNSDIIRMDRFDYFLRMGIFLIAYGIGVVINRIYVNRLKESMKKTESQKLISEVSYEFVTADKENIDEKIIKLLEDIGEHFKIDRSYICLLNFSENKISNNYEWCRENIDSIARENEELSFDYLPWWLKELKDKGLINIKDTNDIGNRLINEEDPFLGKDTKSIIAIPMETSLGLMGFARFDSVNNHKSWEEEDIDLLKILVNILLDGLVKIQSEKEIEYLAYYDHLTGLANRTLFTDRLRQAIELAKRNEKFIAVIFMDLDGFKMINDTMGHSGGDEILKMVANNLTRVLRKTDTVARFGGDEFLMLVNNIEDANSIKEVADKIMGTFSQPLMIEEHEFFVTGSAGVAVYPVDGEDTETLIKNADIAMYRAKASGKNKYVLCTENMKEEVKKNMILSNHLFRVIEKNELTVYYQPQICIETGTIIGLEALLRWKHSEFGQVPPDVFIPLAEKNGAINKIGEWVLRTACEQNKKWQDMDLLHARMGVNLSVIQFNDPLIVEKIEKIIKETGIEARYLDLEITESVAVKENAHIIEILNRLKKLGISISIDDFGTEYSSLSRLKVLPIDRIKIDMQFIHGIEGSSKDQAITKIIINLAKSLELDVIAEGVETKEQMEFLNQRMCDEAQGYYYYKPMPAEELEKLLIKDK